MLVCVLVIWSLTTVTFAGHGKGYGHVKKQLQDYFQQEADAKALSGSVIIAKEGKILLKKGFGLADYEIGKPNNPGTVFAIASMTKAFTSMSIMILEERGLLSVNDLVSDYVPEYPNGDQMTIHNLLGMTAGIPNFLLYVVEIGQLHTPEDLFESFMYEPLAFEPGTQYEYCNSCYVLLGMIIERVSGMTYRDFINTNILEPLNMRHTCYDPYDLEFLYKRAIGYDDITVDPPIFTTFLSASVAYSAGGIYSDVKDMYRWAQSLYTEQLVSSETLDRIFTPGFGDYGYGWWIDTLEINGEPHRHMWHWGSYWGFHGIISRLVDEKITCIILLNTTTPYLATDEPTDLLNFVSNAAAIIFDASHK
jgi:CubicO group peptidase (beta-lactamase class C family)